MSNNRPPGGNRPPGKNNPFGKNPLPFQPSRPPTFFYEGPTWSNRFQNPNRPQILPPKSSPFPPTPVSPFGRPPLPLKKPPLKLPGGGLLGLLLFGGLLLLDWWLSQPSPPPDTLPPSNPVYQLNPLKSYLLEIDTEIQVDGTNYRDSTTEVLSGIIKVSFPIFYSNHPSGGTCYGYSLFGTNNSEIVRRASPTVFPPWSSIKTGVAVHLFRITDLTINQGVPPLPPPTGPAPPYQINNTFNTTNNFSPPAPFVPSFAPPGTNPFTSPNGTPGPSPFTSPNPSPGNPPGDNPNDDDDSWPPPWWEPFGDPFGNDEPYTPPQPAPPFERQRFLSPNPTTNTSGDPIVDNIRNPFNIPQSTPIGAPAVTPTLPPNTQPFPTNKQPTTITPPDPNKDKNPLPFFPPFPIVNPQDPKIENSSNPPPPVNQTPPGNNCCVPTPVDQKLNDANKKLDALTPMLQAVDLRMLAEINNKLGPQITGGLSGYLQDRFTKLWKSRVVDRALNLMATAAAIHNAVMLSRNIGSTLISTLGNALNIIGIKDGDEVAQNFSTVIGDQIENIVKGLIGAENYTTLSETWAKANRIYQSAINIYQLMTDSLFGITEGLEQTAKYTGKIGNALKKSGTILENSYNWMTETFNFSSGKNRKIDRVIQGLQQASEVVSDLESITSEFRSVTENVAEIKTQVDTIKGEVEGKEKDKKDEETKSKEDSQSPSINKSDLIKPEN